MASNIQHIEKLQHGQCHRIKNESGEEYGEEEVWRVHDSLFLYEQQESGEWKLLGVWKFTDTNELEEMIEWANAEQRTLIGKQFKEERYLADLFKQRYGDYYSLNVFKEPNTSFFKVTIKGTPIFIQKDWKVYANFDNETELFTITKVVENGL